MTQPDLRRDILPIPDARFAGLTTYDVKDPNTKFPPIRRLRPPEGAPSILMILIDDAGFGSSSAFGGSGRAVNRLQVSRLGSRDTWRSSQDGC